MVIPHRKYDLLTGEIRPEKNHDAYFGGGKETWRAKDALAEAKYLHFSDWPMPKPWLEALQEDWDRYTPKCKNVSETEMDCSDRDAWLEIRRDFTARRVRICGKTYDEKAPLHNERRMIRPRHEASL
jgi:hypothetical protein